MVRCISSHSLGSSTAIALLLLTGAAFAQDGGAVVLERIDVEAQAGDGSATGPVDGYVAKQTLTGSKTATPIAEIPQSISVIGRDEMDDRGARKVDEALRYTSGVFTQPFGYDSDTNWMFIRGFQATQTGTFMDGMPLYSYAFGAFFVDSFGLERIEVLKGASSVLYGGSNPGGLLNYVSKRPGERIRSIETGVDIFGTGYLGFDFGDKANDVFSYRVNGKLEGGTGYTDFSKGFQGTISPSVMWSPDEDTKLTILANYTHLDQTHNGGAFLPYYGTVAPASYGFIDRTANFTEPGIDTYERSQAMIGYEFEHRFDNGITVRQNARFGYADIHEIQVYPYGYDGFAEQPVDPANLLERIHWEHKTKVASFTTDNQIEGKFETGSVEHTLLFGVDYKFFGMDQVQASVAATDISADNPVFGSAQPAPIGYLDQTIKQHQLGIYAQEQMRFGDGFIVTLGGRHDFVSTDVDGTSATLREDNAWSGRAGIAYRFDNGLVPYASASTFFNPLFGSSPIVGIYKPETGHQFEVGLKYQPTWFDGLFTVSLFDLTRQNVVTGPFLAETQLGEVRSRGVEFEAKANVTDNIRLTAAFAAMDVDITEDADPTVIGKTPYVIPETQASLWADYTFKGTGTIADGLVLGAGVRFMGSSWADNQNTLKVPSAALVDAKIGYKRDNWGAEVAVTNLFDKVYVASCQTSLACYYGESRAIKFKVNATW